MDEIINTISADFWGTGTGFNHCPTFCTAVCLSAKMQTVL